MATSTCSGHYKQFRMAFRENFYWGKDTIWRKKENVHIFYFHIDFIIALYILENPDIQRHFRVFLVYIESFYNVEVFARLGSSHSFLSMIFGILMKFWIDIGEKVFSSPKNRNKKNRDDKK